MDVDQFVTLMHDEEFLKFALPELSESERGDLIYVVSSKLLDQYEQAGLIDDLDRAVMITEQAIELTPDDRSDRAERLNNTGDGLPNVFDQTRLTDLLHRVIMKMAQAIESTPYDHPDHEEKLKNLSAALQKVCEMTGLMNNLDSDITAPEETVKSSEEPPKSNFCGMAEEGPVVMFNVHHTRSDAILITMNEIRSLHLPLLTPHALEDFTNRFLNAIAEQDANRYRHARREINKVLEWLWDVAVSPILDDLGFSQAPSDDKPWPRIWWIGSGLLNILPIHASGYHDSIPPRTVLDRVISSYTPSLKFLSGARERAARADRINLKDKAILITMPTTPGLDSLPFVTEEVRELENLFSQSFIAATVMQNPTKANVLFELSKYTIAHFACHGVSEHDPSQSGFLLEDWRTSPLKVQDLIPLDIQSAKFAYLSVCHTSSMRDFRLLDELINLSTAIHVSGYVSVVGSLWQVGDRYSSEIATDVYSWILEEGRLNAGRSAEGLNKAIRNLRERSRFRGKHDPLIWAPFIHIGI